MRKHSKTMKSTVLVCALWMGCSVGLFAQEFKAKLANSKDRKISIEMDASTLKIEGYDGDELIIKGNGFQEPPEQAKGLRSLYNSAVDNTGIGLAVTTQGNGLKIEKASRKSTSYILKVPKKVAILYQQVNWNGGSISISNVDGDLEVKTNNGKIDLLNVTGPVVANSTNGAIKVVYSSLNQEKPSAISSISSAIDVSLPTNAKSTLSMKSISGEIYTDLDLDLKNAKEGMSRVGGGHSINATTNGGGVEIKLSSISSNIYLRKQ